MYAQKTVLDHSADAYADLWFDYNHIAALPSMEGYHPDLIHCSLSPEYRNLSERIEKEGLNDPRHIAHIDAFMLLYLFKYGVIGKPSARRLAASGHVSIYRTDIPPHCDDVEAVRLLPKGLSSIMKSLEDYRVATLVFPLMSNVTPDVLEDVLDIYYVIEHIHMFNAAAIGIFRGGNDSDVGGVKESCEPDEEE